MVTRIALLYLIAVLFFAWGILAGRYSVFPWSAIYPIGKEFHNYWKGFSEKEGELLEKLSLHHQEKQSEFETEGFTVLDESFTDHGYLLLSRYSRVHNQSIVELVSLKNRDTLYQWVPNLDKILALTRKDYPSWALNNKMAYTNQHALLLENGDLITKSGEGPLVRVDACGEPIWLVDRHFHHSTQIDAGGALIVPIILENNPKKAIYDDRDDAIAIVSLDGRIISETSIREILLSNGYRGIFYGVGRFERDRTHLNDATPILRDSGIAKKGDIAISLRHLSLVGLYRPNTKKLVWSQIGPWLNQHDVRLLNGDRYSVFGNDNVRAPKGKEDKLLSGHSEIYIYDSRTSDVVTPYTKALQSFAVGTITQGRSRILENGDAFVEETDRSRILRITKNAARWTYVNGTADGVVGALHWSRYLEPGEINLKWMEEIKCD